MYQPKIKDALIRKLYAVAKRNHIPMTYVINAILEHYLIHEPEPSATMGKSCRKAARRREAWNLSTPSTN